MMMKWLDLVDRVFMDDELSGGGEPVQEVAQDAAPEPVAVEAPSEPEQLSFDMPEIVSAAIHQQPQQQQAPPQQVPAQVPQQVPTQLPTPQPHPELPPIPSQELFETDFATAMKMMDARTRALSEQATGAHQTEVQRLKAELEQTRKEAEGLKTGMDVDYGQRAAASLHAADTTLRTKVYGENGIFAKSKEYRSSPKVREVADSLISDFMAKSNWLLKHPDPNARAEGFTRLKEVESDPRFARRVLGIAAAEAIDFPNSTDSVQYQGGYMTTGSPHSGPAKPGIDPEVAKALRDQGISEKEYLAAKKAADDGWL